MSSIEYLYHYYEQHVGPFVNLSALDPDEATVVLDRARAENRTMAALRFEGYLDRRRELEHLARGIFMDKGGKPRTGYPHYMVIGACEWLRSWYIDGQSVRMHLSEFAPDTLSFSYGDLFPTFSDRVRDGKEYRRQVYTLSEIEVLVAKYGLPQHWNPNGEHGPERYVEVHVWDHEPLARFLKL